MAVRSEAKTSILIQVHPFSCFSQTQPSDYAVAEPSYLSRPSMTLCPQGLPYSYVLPGLEASLSPASSHIGGVWAPHLPPALTDLIHVVLGQKQSGSRCLWGKKKKLQKSKLCHSSNKVQEILDKQQFR